jgi:hypothetical protein
MPRLSGDACDLDETDYEVPDIPASPPRIHGPAIMTFYSTPELERKWQDLYIRHVEGLQAAMDNETLQFNIEHRVTAYAFVHKPIRVFEVRSDGIYCDGVLCPNAPLEGGGIYKLDPSFHEKIEAFHAANAEYEVIFRPTGCDPCLNYCAGEHVYPATLRVCGACIHIENKEAYDIGCS